MEVLQDTSGMQAGFQKTGIYSMHTKLAHVSNLVWCPWNKAHI